MAWRVSFFSAARAAHSQPHNMPAVTLCFGRTVRRIFIELPVLSLRIQGFATQSSYAVGDKVLFKVKTSSRAFSWMWSSLWGGPATGSVFHSLNRPGLTQLRCHGKSKDSIVLIFTASAGTIAWVHERLLASNLMYSCHKSSLNATRSSLKTFREWIQWYALICEEGMLHVLVVLWLIWRNWF